MKISFGSLGKSHFGWKIMESFNQGKWQKYHNWAECNLMVTLIDLSWLILSSQPRLSNHSHPSISGKPFLNSDLVILSGFIFVMFVPEWIPLDFRLVHVIMLPVPGNLRQAPSHRLLFGSLQGSPLDRLGSPQWWLVYDSGLPWFTMVLSKVKTWKSLRITLL